MVSASSTDLGQAHLMCLTPTRNESWILNRFLAANGTWATHIVVADQGSTDGTLEQLKSAPKVSLVVNQSSEYNEHLRQSLLLERARQFPGRRILLALDADEVLSANWSTSREWEQLLRASPGTVLRFRWVNILPGFDRAWIPPQMVPLGYVDDGAAHTHSGRIHNPRLPLPPDAPVLDFQEIVVLHFQYVLWERMLSKQRWYQAWEWLNQPQMGALNIFRKYQHMHGSWRQQEIQAVRPEWFAAYDRRGIEFRTLTCEPVTWWDREVMKLFRLHGTRHFRKIAIWDVDWNAIASRLGWKRSDYGDPRSLIERCAHHLLTATQGRRNLLLTRCFEKLLRWGGW